LANKVLKRINIWCKNSSIWYNVMLCQGVHHHVSTLIRVPKLDQSISVRVFLNVITLYHIYNLVHNTAITSILLLHSLC